MFAIIVGALLVVTMFAVIVAAFLVVRMLRVDRHDSARAFGFNIPLLVFHMRSRQIKLKQEQQNKVQYCSTA
jgi:hypothetical protein